MLTGEDEWRRRSTRGEDDEEKEEQKKRRRRIEEKISRGFWCIEGGTRTSEK